jgi:hypothetical protein
LERIRDIRASERRVYLRVREIIALAADYEAADPDTQVFFQTIQNKLHFARPENRGGIDPSGPTTRCQTWA